MKSQTAHYWKRWEVLDDNVEDENGRRFEIRRDPDGGIHIIEDFPTFDGQHFSAHFDEHGKYIDWLNEQPLNSEMRKRAGWTYIDREVTIQEAVQLWIDCWVPEKLRPFFTSK